MPVQKSIYPRHFGLIFLTRQQFEQFIQRINDKNIPFEIPCKTRFANSKIEHQSFFLKDPSLNLLEFKYYTYESAIFERISLSSIGEE